MSEHAIDVRFVVERADSIDHPHLARLLHALYRAECNEMLSPNDVAMVRLLERSLSVDAASEGTATFVIRDRLHSNRIVASVVASTSRQPRSSPLTPKHVGHVVRTLGPRSSARFLTTQLRLSQLLCATLPERTTQLHSLIVNPDCRGYGLGVMLVDAVEQYAASVGDTRVHLYILDGNDVDRFYQRLGYGTQHIRPRLAAYPGRAMSKTLPAYIWSPPKRKKDAMTTPTVEIIKHRGTYNDDFYWERVDRNLGWLGENDEEARARQTALRDSVVGVAGAGGIGGSTTLRLIRMGVGAVKIADNDEFDTTNIQRQVGADLTHLGGNKAAVIGEMGAEISGDVSIDVFPEGITDATAQPFVDGCDLVLDQIDVYAVDAHYSLHEAFRRSDRCKAIITVLTIGHAAYVFKYTKSSMQIEEVYGIPKRSGDDLSEAELRQLIGRIIPEQPDFPSREAFDRWWVDNRTVSIWAGTPPLCEGVLAERAALELMDFPGTEPLPVQPGYAILDTKSWTSKTYSGAWWNDPQHPRQD